VDNQGGRSRRAATLIFLSPHIQWSAENQARPTQTEPSGASRRTQARVALFDCASRRRHAPSRCGWSGCSCVFSSQGSGCLRTSAPIADGERAAFTSCRFSAFKVRLHAMSRHPLGYFLTWTTHGTWLYGDERYSVDDEHKIYGSPFVSPNAARNAYHAARLSRPPVVLNHVARQVVTQAIHDHCAVRDWLLHTINVRSNHVHVVVSCAVSPRLAMDQLKGWGTRRLREAGLFGPTDPVWTVKGSKRYLWDEAALRNAILYVAEGQGSLPHPTTAQADPRPAGAHCQTEPRGASPRTQTGPSGTNRRTQQTSQPTAHSTDDLQPSRRLRTRSAKYR
jgi:REP element-mobilizing transposase RayT